MDSDKPDFSSLLQVSKKHRAQVLADVAHDLGALGPDGRGNLGEDRLMEQVEFLIGSFSKTVACIGGFFAGFNRGANLAVRAFSGSYTFSNFLIPVQTAAVTMALEIVRSPEGAHLRTQVLERACLIREQLNAAGFKTLGAPSPIVIIEIGSEQLARLCYRACLRSGLIVNCIEYPACRLGAARLRLQLTPNHTPDDIEEAARILQRAIGQARDEARDLESVSA